MFGYFGITQVFVWFAGFSLLCWLLAQVRDQSRQFLQFLNGIVFSPIRAMEDGLRSWVLRGWDWLKRQLTTDNEDDDHKPINRLVGGLVAAACCTVFLANDLYLISGILVGMGIGESSLSLPIDKSLLSAAALIAAGLLGGIYLSDCMGITALGPFSRIKNIFVRVGTSIFCATLLLGCIMVAVNAADFRALAIYEAMNHDSTAQGLNVDSLLGQDPVAQLAPGLTAEPLPEPEPNINTKELSMHHQSMAVKGLAILSITGTALGFIMVGELASMFLAAAVGGLLVPPFLLLLLITGVRLLFGSIYSFLDSALDLCHAWGARLEGWVRSAWRQIQTAHANRKSRSAQSFEEADLDDGPGFNGQAGGPASRPNQPGDDVVDLRTYAHVRAETDETGQGAAPPPAEGHRAQSRPESNEGPGRESNQEPDVDQASSQSLGPVDQSNPEPNFRPYPTNRKHGRK